MIDVPRLIDTAEAKRHIRDNGGPAQTDAEIEAKLAQATAFVLKMCGTLADDTWDETTVPAEVHTAILLHLTELYTDRGDLERSEPFGTVATRYLIATGYRDPVLA